MVDDSDLYKADAIRGRLIVQEVAPSAFRTALLSVSPADRDAWVDRVLGLDGIAEDGPQLPSGCAPYLPCSVDTLVAAVDEASIDHNDVFVDVGSGVGRAGLLVHLLTGATVVGVEIQSSLVSASRKCAESLNVERFSVVEGDASELAGSLVTGSVFFFYCPFGGDRLSKVIDNLEPIARTRPLRLCAVDLQLPARSWLVPLSSQRHDLVVWGTGVQG